ncbi:hypothetical protein Tco_0662037 [Tanacetum coccineum]
MATHGKTIYHQDIIGSPLWALYRTLDRRPTALTSDVVLADPQAHHALYYFISMQLRSNVRFSALFLDPEENSSVYTNDFPSMILQKIICVSQVTMADANINAPEVPTTAASPPTRSDEQILPRNKWVLVGKSNCFLDVERTQGNLIFKIAVDILKNTNFFKAFTSSSTIPSIYIQQF